MFNKHLYKTNAQLFERLYTVCNAIDVTHFFVYTAIYI